VPEWLEIPILILVPLVWGLGVDYAFELLRRRRNGGASAAVSPELPEDA
jgi:hypothetical protein